MLDGYLGAFMFGLAVGSIAVYFGSAVRFSDFFLNPFNWSSDFDDHWRK